MKRFHKRSTFTAKLLVLLCLLPYAYIFFKSFLGDNGLTLQAYYDVFLASGKYLIRFWRTLGLCILIATGQIFVSVLAGYGFAKYHFPGKNLLFFFLMIIMVLPLQVTLVPNYLILDNMGLLNTQWSLVLPAIFVPLGTFIMTQSFQSLPNDILDAAKLDGCSTGKTLWSVALPMSRGGLVCVTMLSFLDAWSMVEQPIAYLQDATQYPLAVALATTHPKDLGELLACCVLVVLPPLFLFLYYNQELVEGIIPGGLK